MTRASLTRWQTALMLRETIDRYEGIVEALRPTPAPCAAAPSARRALPLGRCSSATALITAEQLEAALAEKEETGRRLGEIVVATAG